MESAHVLIRVDGHEHLGLVEMLGEGHLDHDPVDRRVAIILVD
jgi:hypothetical protein